MNEKWIWLPDFASDMGIWEDDLMGVAPDADHQFVTYEKMVETGLVKHFKLPVKVLARGEITKPLTVHAHHFSAAAK